MNDDDPTRIVTTSRVVAQSLMPQPRELRTQVEKYDSYLTWCAHTGTVTALSLHISKYCNAIAAICMSTHWDDNHTTFFTCYRATLTSCALGSKKSLPKCGAVFTLGESLRSGVSKREGESPSAGSEGASARELNDSELSSAFLFFLVLAICLRVFISPQMFVSILIGSSSKPLQLFCSFFISKIKEAGMLPTGLSGLGLS